MRSIRAPAQALQYVAAGCMLALLAVAPAAAQPVQDDRLTALIERAGQRGSVRVILGGRMEQPFRPEGLLTAAEVAAQRSALVRAQERVEQALGAAGTARTLSRYQFIPFLVAEVDAAALRGLAHSPWVDSIEEDETVGLHLAESASAVRASRAWTAGLTGQGWTVAILDTGVDKSHPFIAGKVVSEACYSTTNPVDGYQSVCPGGVAESTAVNSGLNCTMSSECNHGTHVAGIVAGKNGQNGIHGIAPDASLIAIQVFSYNASANDLMTYWSDLVKGLERVYALRNSYSIAAVNMSLGGGRYTSASSCDAGSASRKFAIDNLRSVGIASVASAGNNAWMESVGSPGCISTAISVAATCDASSVFTCLRGPNGLASYSNAATWVTLAAPGSFILSSIPNGGYESYNGTSMAAPHVAGALAVLRQAFPSMTVEKAISWLRTYGQPVYDTRHQNYLTALRRLDLSTLGSTALPTRRLLVQTTEFGTGAGTVSSTPAGINGCASSCAADFPDASVTLDAAPATGSVFVGWLGACTGNSPTCVVSLAGDRTAVAVFRNDTLPPMTTIAKGQTISPLSGGTGSSTYFVFDVPVGATNLSLSTTGGNGDLDLYLRRLKVPGIGVANCSREAVGNTESCTYATPEFGRWYVLLYGYSAYDGASIALNYTGNALDAQPDAFSFPAQTAVALSSVRTSSAVAPVNFNQETSISVTIGRYSINCSGLFVDFPATFLPGNWVCARHTASTGVGSTLTTTVSIGGVGGNFSSTTAGAATFALSVSRSGLGSGTVTSVPAGIVCGSTCSAIMTAGSSVTLKAVAAPGSQPGGWTGDCAGQPAKECVLLMNQARSATAIFSSLP